MAMTENDISGFEEKQSHQCIFDLTMQNSPHSPFPKTQ